MNFAIEKHPILPMKDDERMFKKKRDEKSQRVLKMMLKSGHWAEIE